MRHGQTTPHVRQPSRPFIPCLQSLARSCVPFPPPPQREPPPTYSYPYALNTHIKPQPLRLLCSLHAHTLAPPPLRSRPFAPPARSPLPPLLPLTRPHAPA